MTDPTQEPQEEKPHKRRWLIVGLVLCAVAGAAVLGYVFGGNSRDDDVKAADAQAASAQNQAQDQQAQDQQASEAIKTGFEDLGNAITQEDAKDDQAAQQAVDDATKEIQGGFEQLGQEFSQNLDKALSDLKDKVNEAVGSAQSEK